MQLSINSSLTIKYQKVCLQIYRYGNKKHTLPYLPSRHIASHDTGSCSVVLLHKRKRGIHVASFYIFIISLFVHKCLDYSMYNSKYFLPDSLLLPCLQTMSSAVHVVRFTSPSLPKKFDHRRYQKVQRGRPRKKSFSSSLILCRRIRRTPEFRFSPCEFCCTIVVPKNQYKTVQF